MRSTTSTTAWSDKKEIGSPLQDEGGQNHAKAITTCYFQTFGNEHPQDLRKDESEANDDAIADGEGKGRIGHG